MKTNYETISKLAIFEPFVYRLSEISAKSTPKFLEQKDGSNMIHELRNGIAKDCKYFETLKRISEDDRTEYRRDCLREEVRINNREMSAIKRQMKKTMDENQLEKLNDRLGELETENDMHDFEIKRISEYLARIQPIISDTLSPNSFDLVNISRMAILYALQRSTNASIIFDKIVYWNNIYTMYTLDELKQSAIDDLLEDIKHIVIAKKKLKTKDGYRTYTLKQFADQIVRNSINRQRSGIASKTLFMISGYDEQGNEQYIQADKMTTAGGITDIFRKEEFETFRHNLNMTDGENLIARLLMEGRTEAEIGARFGVSQQAMHKRIVKLRNRLAEYEEVKNRRRYHNNNTK